MSANNKAGELRTRPASSKASAFELYRQAQAPRVARLQRCARALDLSPVFVADLPLVAELFDARGELAETWNWGTA